MSIRIEVHGANRSKEFADFMRRLKAELIKNLPIDVQDDATISAIKDSPVRLLDQGKTERFIRLFITPPLSHDVKSHKVLCGILEQFADTEIYYINDFRPKSPSSE